MKPDLNNLKEYTQKASLTQEEKFVMLQNIREYSNNHPIKTSYYSVFFKHSIAYASMFALIIGTSATSFAAEDSLPGDILYPIKTNINEKIVKSLAFSNAQKAKVSVSLVDKRLGELEQMIIENKDTPENIDIIIDKLEEHKEDLKEIQKDENFANSQDSVETYVTLESIVDTHIDILENITDNKETSKSPVATAKQNIEETVHDNKPSLSLVISSEDTSTSTKESDKQQDETVTQIVEFSEQIDPIISSAKTKLQKVDDDNEEKETKEKVSKEIIEKAEKKLEVNLDIEE